MNLHEQFMNINTNLVCEHNQLRLSVAFLRVFKKTPKIREKLGSGWEGQTPTLLIPSFSRIFGFF